MPYPDFFPVAYGALINHTWSTYWTGLICAWWVLDECLSGELDEPASSCKLSITRSLVTALNYRRIPFPVFLPEISILSELVVTQKKIKRLKVVI